MLQKQSKSKVEEKMVKRAIHFRPYLGKASKNHVLLVWGNATLMPDIRAECSITAPTSYLEEEKGNIILQTGTIFTVD